MTKADIFEFLTFFDFFQKSEGGHYFRGVFILVFEVGMRKISGKFLN